MIIKVADQYINLDYVEQVENNPYGLAVHIRERIITLTNADADFFRGVVDALHAITVQSINSKLTSLGVDSPNGSVKI